MIKDESWLNFAWRAEVSLGLQCRAPSLSSWENHKYVLNQTITCGIVQIVLYRAFVGSCLLHSIIYLCLSHCFVCPANKSTTGFMTSGHAFHMETRDQIYLNYLTHYTTRWGILYLTVLFLFNLN